MTDPQRRILECIRDHQEANGYPPTVAEIGEAVGLSSTATVAKHLKHLEGMGYVFRKTGCVRALVVTDEGKAALRMDDSRRRILPYIQKATAEKGYPPTVREIATGCGMAVACVQRALDELEAAGAITRHRGAMRTIRVTGGAPTGD